MQNYGFAPNVFMPSPVPNYPPYHWSIMSNLSLKPFFPWVLKLLQILEQQFFLYSLHKLVLMAWALSMKPLRTKMLRIKLMLAGKAQNGPLIEIWCYLVSWLNMEQTMLLAETKKMKLSRVKLISTATSIVHLILR